MGAGTSVSSSSVSEAVSLSEVSQARRNWSFCGGLGSCEGTVRWVCEDAAEFELPDRELELEFEKEAEAAADANDDAAVGATGSSTTVVRKLSQCSWSSSGLTLRLRSPKPSRAGTGLQDSRNELLGNGPSAIVRRPILRSGGKATALLSLLSWSSSGAFAVSLLAADRSARGLRERVNLGEAARRYDALSRMRENSRALCVVSDSELCEAAAGAKPGVKTAMGRSVSRALRAAYERMNSSRRLRERCRVLLRPRGAGELAAASLLR